MTRTTATAAWVSPLAAITPQSMAPRHRHFGSDRRRFQMHDGSVRLFDLSWGLPFPKSRFVLGDHMLTPLNFPLPHPEFIFTRQFITELSFIEYDRYFQSAEWEWHSYFSAYAIRFLLSRFPRWSVLRPNTDDEAMKAVNGAIFQAFLGLAREQGSTPIVVYFPARPDFVIPRPWGDESCA